MSLKLKYKVLYKVIAVVLMLLIFWTGTLEKDIAFLIGVPSVLLLFILWFFVML